MNHDVCVIIPVYNEGKVVRETLEKVLKTYPFVVCIDDGSKDDSATQIRKTNAHMVQHPINMGQGAALQTGIEYALQYPEIEYFVTFDADGQHSLKDVRTMISHLRANKNIDIVLGSRFLGDTIKMKRLKKAILKLAIQFSNATSGLKLTDTHNGLRVFNRHVAKNLNITMPDMAHASEIIQCIADQGFRYQELPVTITYDDYSIAKGQSMMNSVNILFDVLLHKAVKK